MIRRCCLFAILVGTSAVVFPAAALACSVCLTGGTPNGSVVNAFQWSVLFLIAMPLAVVGSIAGWLVYSHWRADVREKNGANKKTPVLRLAWIYKESKR